MGPLGHSEPPAEPPPGDTGADGGGDSAAGRAGDRELLAWLASHDVDPAAAERASPAEQRATALASDLVFGRGNQLSARQLAARAGVELDQAVGMLRDLGIVVADLDEPWFSAADAAVVGRLSQASEVGIVRGSDLLRVVAGAMERIAEAAVAVYVQGPENAMRRRSASVVDAARANMRATELALDVGAALSPIFRHHMRQAVARQRVMQEGVARREMARLAVGFVDLVGSTGMQAGLDPDELGDVVNRFEATAFDVVIAGGGRLVKFIGDAIMFTAVEPVAGCRIVADLISAFTADGTLPRGGLVFGEVLFRHGDYYGPVVNLAARLVDAAIPGEVLVDAAVVDAIDGDVPRFDPAGRRMLKGIPEPVRVWTLVTAA